MRVVRAQRVIAAALLFFLSALAAAAQDDPCLRRTVAVSVLDAEGRPVPGLAPQNFHAEVKRRAIPVVSAKLDGAPHRVVVVLDASASMFDGEKQWGLAKSLAEQALAASPKSFQAGLIVFNDAVRIKIPVQGDPSPARQALAELPARPDKRNPATGRHTALWDALVAASELLNPGQFGDAIYAVTDGEDNESRTELKQLRRTLATRGVRLFSAWFGYEILNGHPTVEELEVFDFLSMVTESGGIVAHIPPTPRWGAPLPKYSQIGVEQLKQVRAEADQIFAAMQFTYRLEIALPATLDKAEKWKLLVLDSKNQKANAVLAYPMRLEPCAATSAKAN